MIRNGLRSGEVAAQAGVNLQTLRYYERRGILAEPKRTRAGYRQYPPDTIKLIRFVKRAQELGFTLEQIEELLRLRQTRSRERTRARGMAAEKLAEVEGKIRQLRAMAKALRRLVDSCACDGSPLDCPIIEALEDAPGAASAEHDGLGPEGPMGTRAHAAGGRA